MSKHTPGPWGIESHNDGLSMHSFIRIAAEKNVVIAEIDLCQTDPNYTTQECASNARLIAAAPDLKDLAVMLLGYLNANLEDLENSIMEAEHKANYRTKIIATIGLVVSVFNKIEGK